MAEKGKERRKNYFINKRFQSLFILKFCALVVLGSMISGAIVYMMSKAALTTTFENCRLTVKSAADFILPAVLLSSGVVIVLIGISAVAVTLFTSHKIAGPLYRIEKDIEEVASGNLNKRVNLREGDEIKALAESLNYMTTSLRASIDEVKRDIRQLESVVTKEDLKKRIAKIRELLDKFQT